MKNFELPAIPRLLMRAELEPLQGRRFQPTGFPDVGAATFTLPDGSEHLIVESAQSIANRLEAAVWDASKNELVESLHGLSYVRVQDPEGNLLTTSILEAHRLNSAYIEKTEFAQKTLRAEIGFDEKKPVDRKRFLAALAKYDVNCLLHGVFLESIAGVLRIPRALSGFIEADGVTRVQTGGVKNDRVQANRDEEGGKTAAEGFGNVPFHRTEFSATQIVAYFNLDLDQLREYRLGVDLERLLLALSLFKVQRFLASGLRLRTACDLGVKSVTVTKGDIALPTLENLERALPDLVQDAAKNFASPPVTTAVFDAAEQKAKKGTKK